MIDSREDPLGVNLNTFVSYDQRKFNKMMEKIKNDTTDQNLDPINIERNESEKLKAQQEEVWLKVITAVRSEKKKIKEGLIYKALDWRGPISD